MKIPDDIRRTVSDITEKMFEKGQQVSKDAQLQVQIKKHQVEHAKKIHELGKRTHEWYRSGTMIVSGPVPGAVVDICAQLDETQKKIDQTQRELDQAREQARRAAMTSGASTGAANAGSSGAGSTSNSQAAAQSTPPALNAPADSGPPPGS